ncbi:MAG: arsenate reductase family protein [Solobacterium sp.]|nr:arsenate reductase family protein [Solobacterium sp.]
MLFIWYPKCGTCRKAKKWLDSHQLSYSERLIKEDPPAEKELRTWHAQSGLPLRKFFNTSGQAYRALNLKEKLPSMTEDEMFTLLASDGMLVKRPVLITDDGKVKIGFREEEYEELI